jgi:6-phospho-beta-glucosidase
MNHCGFWVDDSVVMASALAATHGVDPADVEQLGALPTPYVRYYLHPERQLEAQLAAGESRAQALKRQEAEMLEQYSSHTEPGQQTRRGALWYRVSIVPLIDAIVHGGQDTVVLGLPNDGAVPWAPEDATVELPTDVQAGGALQRCPAVILPTPAVDLLAEHATFEALTARALVGARSYDDVRARRSALVEALAANPMVPGARLAERLVDHILANSPS